jgi:predicted transposase YbfD/YdcC
MVFTATMAGCHSWKEIHAYAITHEYVFKPFLKGYKGVPSVDTIARTISKLDPDKGAKMVADLGSDFLKRAKQRPKGRPKLGESHDVVAIDGKTIRGAAKPGETKSKVVVVNAVIDNTTMAVKTVFDKSNEITAIIPLLETLNESGHIKGNTITIDAMGCQKHIASKILSFGGNYLFGLKGNQTGLHEEVRDFFEVHLINNQSIFNAPLFVAPVTKNGGKIVSRTATLIEVNDEVRQWIPKINEWDSIRTLLKVTTHTEKTTEDSSSDETRYFISSACFSVEQMFEIVVKHWSVETNHGHLDRRESFNEDAIKIHRGKAPEILSIMRKMAINFLNPLKVANNESFGGLLRCIESCPEYLTQILNNEPKKVPPMSEFQTLQGSGAYAKDMPKSA